MLNRLKHLIRSAFFMYNWNYGVLALFLLSISLLFFALRNLITNKKIKNTIISASLLIYVGLMLYAALIDRNISEEASRYCLIPFNSYYQFFNGNNDIMQQSIMNVAFFYPFGFLLACLDFEFINKRKWVIVLSAFIFSLSIEICQYIFCLGYAEVDDVIHNTLGTAAAVLIFKLFDKLIRHYRSVRKM